MKKSKKTPKRYNPKQKSPKYHLRRMKKRLQREIAHLRQDIRKVADPRFKAMFETSAEVLKGLVKAFRDYGKKREAAWK